jgi:hypothetical protein
MHICPHEVMLVLAAVPVLRWLLCLAVRLRLRWTEAQPCPCDQKEKC